MFQVICEMKIEQLTDSTVTLELKIEDSRRRTRTLNSCGAYRMTVGSNPAFLFTCLPHLTIPNNSIKNGSLIAAYIVTSRLKC